MLTNIDLHLWLMMFVSFVTTTRPAKVITSIQAQKKLLTLSFLHNSFSKISGTMLTIGGSTMNSVTLEISSRETINDRFLRAFQGERQGQFLSFESPELLFKVISGKRWDLLKVMTGAGPITIREAARRMHRDVKAVHGDVHALLNAGLLQKTDTGLIVFPYDAVHVDFMLKAA